MRIEEEIKLDYKDVLFKPKRSKLTSRKDVDLMRTFKFHNSGRTWTGIPVMASNMDGVGTFSKAKVFRNDIQQEGAYQQSIRHPYYCQKCDIFSLSCRYCFYYTILLCRLVPIF